MTAIENAVVVKNKTRLESLIERFNSKNQAKFYIEHAGGNFSDYEIEHEHFYRSLDIVYKKLSPLIKIKTLERFFLPSYIFTKKDVVIVVGQDGLVANTAKYIDDIPLIAVNPDIERFDGFLLPYDPYNADKALDNVLNGRYSYKYITMAEAKLNDGQRLLAFNDLFVGISSHVSARYRITYKKRSENHSSSGIIVSTGAGSTGWLSSLFNMAEGITKTFAGDKSPITGRRLPLDTDHLIFIVREPFLSKTSRVNLVAGQIYKNNNLVIESFMPTNGIIFSDGIEADYMRFNSGAVAEIGIAKEKAKLVMRKKKK